MGNNRVGEQVTGRWVGAGVVDCEYADLLIMLWAIGVEFGSISSSTLWAQ